MADPAWLSDLELERALRDLGAHYPYPPTPNLAVSVRARIAARPSIGPTHAPVWRSPLRLVLAAAIVVVILGTAALINPASRDAIAHFFHVRGVVVSRVSSPLPSLSPITPVNLGQQTTLDEARSAVSFPIAVPPELGAPDAVYIDRTVPGGEVALAYKPRAGIPLVRQTGLGVLVTEFRGDLVHEFITKEVGPGTTVEEVSVHGDPGWWIAGQPHEMVVNNRLETLRLASNTLVWEHGGVTYRIESGLGKADAMRLATGLP
jgi:hypothetical protein